MPVNYEMDFTDVLRGSLEDAYLIQSTHRKIGGRGVDVERHVHTRPGRGVVVPGKINLQRLPDGSRVSAHIDVYTRDLLVAEQNSPSSPNSRDADVIIWHDNTYVVVMLEDYSKFGRGFWHASCDLQTLGASPRNREGL